MWHSSNAFRASVFLSLMLRRTLKHPILESWSVRPVGIRAGEALSQPITSEASIVPSSQPSSEECRALLWCADGTSESQACHLLIKKRKWFHFKDISHPSMTAPATQLLSVTLVRSTCRNLLFPLHFFFCIRNLYWTIPVATGSLTMEYTVYPCICFSYGLGQIYAYVTLFIIY